MASFFETTEATAKNFLASGPWEHEPGVNDRWNSLFQLYNGAVLTTVP
jgi:hypothetical protein